MMKSYVTMLEEKAEYQMEMLLQEEQDMEIRNRNKRIKRKGRKKKKKNTWQLNPQARAFEPQVFARISETKKRKRLIIVPQQEDRPPCYDSSKDLELLEEHERKEQLGLHLEDSYRSAAEIIGWNCYDQTHWITNPQTFLKHNYPVVRYFSQMKITAPSIQPNCANSWQTTDNIVTQF